MPLNSASPGILVFISHSTRDRALAEAVSDLIQRACHLRPDRIRCTSAEAYRFEPGGRFEDMLRHEVLNAAVVVALLTPASLATHFVLLELGARWGAGLSITPIVAGGVKPQELVAPLAAVQVARADDENSLSDLVDAIRSKIQGEPVSRSDYDAKLKDVVRLANALLIDVDRITAICQDYSKKCYDIYAPPKITKTFLTNAIKNGCRRRRFRVGLR